MVLALELQGVCLGHHQGVLIPLKELGLINFLNRTSCEVSFLDDRDLCHPFPLHSEPCALLIRCLEIGRGYGGEGGEGVIFSPFYNFLSQRGWPLLFSISDMSIKYIIIIPFGPYCRRLRVAARASRCLNLRGHSRRSCPSGFDISPDSLSTAF